MEGMHVKLYVKRERAPLSLQVLGELGKGIWSQMIVIDEDIDGLS